MRGLESPAISIPRHWNAATVFLDSHVAQGHGSRTAIISAGRRHTYGEIREEADRIGNALKDLGVRIEERVLIVLPDGPHFAAAFFGIMKMGAVSVPASTLLSPEDYLRTLEDSRAAALIIAKDLCGKIEGIRASCHHLHHVVAVGDGPAPPGTID